MKYKLGELEVTDDDIQEINKLVIGGLADPLGQLSQWLWGQIYNKIDSAVRELKSYGDELEERVATDTFYRFTNWLRYILFEEHLRGAHRESTRAREKIEDHESVMARYRRIQELRWSKADEFFADSSRKFAWIGDNIVVYAGAAEGLARNVMTLGELMQRRVIPSMEKHTEALKKVANLQVDTVNKLGGMGQAFMLTGQAAEGMKAHVADWKDKWMRISASRTKMEGEFFSKNVAAIVYSGDNIGDVGRRLTEHTKKVVEAGVLQAHAQAYAGDNIAMVSRELGKHSTTVLEAGKIVEAGIMKNAQNIGELSRHIEKMLSLHEFAGKNIAAVGEGMGKVTKILEEQQLRLELAGRSISEASTRLGEITKEIERHRRSMELAGRSISEASRLMGGIAKNIMEHRKSMELAGRSISEASKKLGEDMKELLEKLDALDPIGDYYDSLTPLPKNMAKVSLKALLATFGGRVLGEEEDPPELHYSQTEALLQALKQAYGGTTYTFGFSGIVGTVPIPIAADTFAGWLKTIGGLSAASTAGILDMVSHLYDLVALGLTPTGRRVTYDHAPPIKGVLKMIPGMLSGFLVDFIPLLVGPFASLLSAVVPSSRKNKVKATISTASAELSQPSNIPAEKIKAMEGLVPLTGFPFGTPDARNWSVARWYDAITSKDVGGYLSFMLGIIGSLFLVKALSGVIRAFAATFSDVGIDITLFGAGTTFTFKPFAFLSELAGVVWEGGSEFLKAMMYGFAIWCSRVIYRPLNMYLRNWVPVELPESGLLVGAVRRFMPFKEDFKKMLAILIHTLELYGYSDDVVFWYTGTTGSALLPGLIGDGKAVEEWIEGVRNEITNKAKAGFTLTIYDRFAKPRKVPLALIYNLPTPSELCRMMIHDIFTSPPSKVPEGGLTGLDAFSALMQAHGYVPDIAYMFYLLHYRYPTFEKLWQFYCRARAGMLWYEPAIREIPEVQKGIGFQPQPPTAFNNPDEEKDAFIRSAIEQYAKWWDYAPFAWVEGFTSDRWLMLDLMADIPTRIDARWMYKWMIIGDEDLRRIVIARGYHPKWVDMITVAEAMNALAEERTYARGGVERMFREGFLTVEGLRNRLSDLAKFKILGKEYTVRFLPAEVELLALRGKYDRAYDILHDYARDLVRAGVENILTVDEIKENLSKATEGLREALRLPELTVDEGYWTAYAPVIDTYKGVVTTRRLRTWIRYMLYRILTRMREGYITEEEAKKYIEELSEKAKLTETEVKILEKTSKLMVEVFRRELKVEGILRKYSRGVLSKEEASEQLKKEGIDPDLIDDLLERYVRNYTISIASLLAYADLVEIPEEVLKTKMAKLGVPKDEQDILLQVFKVKPIRSERAKAISEYIDSFEDGYMTEEELKAALAKLGKKKAEIELIVKAAKIAKGIRTNKLKIKAITGKLRRGAITTDEAKKELKGILKDEALVSAYLDAYMTVHTLSIANLLSYSDIVKIPENVIDEKLKALNVPPDEARILKEVFKLRPIRDERARAIRELLDYYDDGYMTEDELRASLTELGKKPEEIELLVKIANMSRKARVNRLKVEAILNMVRRGAIDIEEARRELSKVIRDRDVLEATLERAIRTYTLNVSTLLSYAQYVHVPEDLVKNRLKALGVPERDAEIILQVFRIRPIRDEIAKVIREYMDQFEEGYINEEEFRKALAGLGKSEREVELLTQACKMGREIRAKGYLVRAVLKRLSRGVLSRDEALNELKKLGLEESLAVALVEENAPIYRPTVNTYISMMEYIPISPEEFERKMELMGVPEDERDKYWAYALAREISSELLSYARELGNDYVEGLISEDQFKRELDNLATLWGQAKRILGVDWVVLSPNERAVFVMLYKARKARREARRGR